MIVSTQLQRCSRLSTHTSRMKCEVCRREHRNRLIQFAMRGCQWNSWVFCCSCMDVLIESLRMARGLYHVELDDYIAGINVDRLAFNHFACDYICDTCYAVSNQLHYDDKLSICNACYDKMVRRKWAVVFYMLSMLDPDVKCYCMMIYVRVRLH